MAHEHHVFYNPPPATSADVLAALDRGELSCALDAMVGAVLYGDGDWKELQEFYLGLLDHEERQVKALAATCLGHLARVYGKMDEARVVAALRRARSTPRSEVPPSLRWTTSSSSSIHGVPGGGGAY